MYAVTAVREGYTVFVNDVKLALSCDASGDILIFRALWQVFFFKHRPHQMAFNNWLLIKWRESALP